MEQSIPDVLTAAAVAKFFRVSVDYLSGNSDVRSTDTNLKAICDYTGLSEKSIMLCSKLREYKELTEIMPKGRSYIYKIPYYIDIISAFLEAMDSRSRMFTRIQFASNVNLNEDYYVSISDAISDIDKESITPEVQKLIDIFYNSTAVLYGENYKNYLLQEITNESNKLLRDVVDKLTPEEYFLRESENDDDDDEDEFIFKAYLQESTGIYNKFCGEISKDRKCFHRDFMSSIRKKLQNGTALNAFESKWYKLLENDHSEKTLIEFVTEWRDWYGVNKTKKE